MSKAPGSVFVSQRIVYLFPEGSEYVVPFERGQRPLGVADGDDDELVPIMLELDIEVLLAIDVEAVVVDELVRVDDDVIIADDELLELDTEPATDDELLLADDDDDELNELESETGPATLNAALVAPLYTKAPLDDFV